MSGATPEVIERLALARVGCAGDVMLDRFVSGTVERISPEAPIPVLTITGEEAMLGGAGNVARNVAALGARVHFAAVVGADAEGDEIRTLLSRLSAVGARLVVDASRPTTLKTRFVAAGQQILRADRESTRPLDDAVRGVLAESVAAFLGACDVLVLSDYAKGTLAGGLAARLIGAAKRRALPVIVDPKGADYAIYAGCDVIAPNRRELGQALGRPLAAGEEEAAARALIARFGFGAVLVTLGAEGMLLVPSTDAAIRLAAQAREVFDVSGAGDTVVATLAAAIASGAPLATAADLANIAAGIVVGKVGTAVATIPDLTLALRERNLACDAAKVLRIDALLEALARWRRKGLRIGFTNGCFDLLHPGHLSLLNQAKAACDRLIVGLNSDASVARLKGADRPVQGEQARALVLASLAAVDAVILFAEDTPMALIEAIRPDVLVKGADYRREDVVGADLVEGYGGRVLLAALADGYSTSDTLARIRS